MFVYTLIGTHAIAYNDLKNKIEDKKKDKEEGERIRARVEKTLHDEKPSKYFFNKEKKRGESQQINILKPKDKLVENKEGILNEIYGFYTNLYSTGEIDINQVNENPKYIEKTLTQRTVKP